VVKHQWPGRVVIGVGGSLGILLKQASCPSLPTFDADAVLSKIVDCCYYMPETEGELQALINQMATDESLFEKSSTVDARDTGLLDDAADNLIGAEHIASLVVRVGLSLKTQVQSLAVVEKGYLHYEYDRMLDRESIVLRLKRNLHAH
jgi:hypothetical protein